MGKLTEDQFIALVQQSEQDAADNISAYKTKLALFALLGYAVIFGVLAALILLVGGTIVAALFSSSLLLLLIKKKAIILVLVAIWTFLRALWIKFDAPTGYELKRDDVPELYEEIDTLTRELKALKIHQVILNNELNAAVVQHPRFGVLGGQKNTLFLGLQLLLALSPSEMRAVLAHEFGHLSGNHSRFSGWIYRIRLTWYRVMEAFDQSNSFGAGLMRRFFDWYAPKFSAYSFALARNNEYEADRVAAELTSADTAAKALVNVYTKAPYIEQEYWDQYFQQADTQPKPPSLPLEGLADFLKHSPISRQKTLELIKREMQVETHYSDTHPALKDRVSSLTDQPVLPDALTTNAAEAWLGKRYKKALRHFDHAWLKKNEQKWQDRYEYVQRARGLLAEPTDPEKLNDDDLWERAHMTREFEGNDAALPLFQQFHTRHPDSIGAGYYIGMILSQQRDQTALRYLRLAFRSPNTIGDAARFGYQLLQDLGKEQEAEQWWQEATQASQKQQALHYEQTNLTLDDHFTAAQLPAAVQQQLEAVLDEHSNVGATWLAQKTLPYADADPVYVVAFRPRGLYFSFDGAAESAQNAVNEQVEANVFVLCLWGDHKDLAKKVKKAGERIR